MFARFIPFLSIFVCALAMAAGPATSPATAPAPATSPAQKDWNKTIQSAIPPLEKLFLSAPPANSTDVQRKEFRAKQAKQITDAMDAVTKDLLGSIAFTVDNVKGNPPDAKFLYTVLGHIEWVNAPKTSPKDSRPPLTVNFQTSDSGASSWKVGDKKKLLGKCSSMSFNGPIYHPVEFLDRIYAPVKPGDSYLGAALSFEDAR